MNLDQFLRAYITAALWSSHGPEEGPYKCENLDDIFGPDDIAPGTLEEMRADCKAFIEANAADLAIYDEKMGNEQWSGSERAGHDFWLTRNGHGCGFWDRGLGDLGDRLSESARAFGEVYLYPGDDGKIYS